MKQIVEGVRNRAEVEWAGGLVRFDTDFIDGYDRKGQLKWQSGWTDIAQASYGLDRVTLTERTGRRLILPYSLALLAALHWLLPSGAKLLQTDGRRSMGWRIASFVFLFAAAFATSLLFGEGFTWSGTAAGFNLQILGLAVSVMIAVIFLIAPPERRSMVLQSQSPPHAWHCLQLADVLDDQVHWFQQRKRPAKISIQAVAASFLGLILAAGIVIPLASRMAPALSAVLGGLCGIVISAFLGTRLKHGPPAGSWLAVYGDQMLAVPARLHSAVPRDSHRANGRICSGRCPPYQYPPPRLPAR